MANLKYPARGNTTNASRYWEMVPLSQRLMMGLAGLFLWGCSSSPEYTVMFSRAHPLQKGGAVLFENNQIGEIKDVRPSEAGGVRVLVVLEKNAKDLVRQGATFLPEVINQGDKKTLALQMKGYDGKSPILPPGSIIRGANTWSELDSLPTQIRLEIAATKIQMRNIAVALQYYETQLGTFPTQNQGLRALIEKPSDVDEKKWEGPYLEGDSIPKDPWGDEFQYRIPGNHNKGYDLWSYGPDKQDNTADDVNNWDGIQM